MSESDNSSQDVDIDESRLVRHEVANSKLAKLGLKLRPTRKDYAMKIAKEKRDAKAKSKAKSEQASSESRDTTEQLSSAEKETFDKFEVEQLLKQEKRSDGWHYLVVWKGFPVEDATWEPENNLNCPELINQLNSKLKGLPDDSPMPVETNDAGDGVNTEENNDLSFTIETNESLGAPKLQSTINENGQPKIDIPETEVAPSINDLNLSEPNVSVNSNDVTTRSTEMFLTVSDISERETSLTKTSLYDNVSNEIGYDGWTYEQKLDFIRNSSKMSDEDWISINWIEFHGIDDSKRNHLHFEEAFAKLELDMERTTDIISGAEYVVRKHYLEILNDALTNSVYDALTKCG